MERLKASLENSNRLIGGHSCHRCHQLKNENNSLKQKLYQTTEMYAVRIRDLEATSDEVIGLQQSRIYSLMKKMKTNDLKYHALIDIIEINELQTGYQNKLPVYIALKKKDEQIFSLNNQLQKALNENRQQEYQMKRNTSFLDDKIAILKKEAEMRDKRASILQSENVEFDRRNRHLESKLKIKQTQLSDEIDKMHEQESEFHKKITSLKIQIQSLEFEIKRLNKNGNSFERDSERKMVKTDNKNVESDEIIISLRQNIQLLKTKIDDKDEKIRNLMEMSNSLKSMGNSEKERTLQALTQKEDQLCEMRKGIDQTIQKMNEQETALGEQIVALEKTIRCLETEIDKRDLGLKELNVSLKRKDSQLAEIQKQLNDKDDKLSNERSNWKHISEQMQEKESAMNKNIISLMTKIEHLEKQKHKTDLKMKNITHDATETDYKQNKNQMEKEINKVNEKLQQTLKILKDTQTELDETKTRLSKAMSDRLTENNPNIADLSDKNRPTKLADRFSELYDNQWTDAFGTLATYFNSEKRTIESLLEILQEAMRFCILKENEQMKNLQILLEFSDTQEQRHEPLSTEMSKCLKDCRKAMSSVAIGNLSQIFVASLKRSTNESFKAAPRVAAFTRECIEVCWFMVIQDPPVVFAPIAMQGSRFDSNLFKPYTSSGTHVEYVVWPALLQYKGGPILMKGVAQGYNKKA